MTRSGGNEMPLDNTWGVHPPPGAARGQPTCGGALAPPCASRGDTARQTVLPGPARSGRAPIAVDVFHETHERATRALASRERVR